MFIAYQGKINCVCVWTWLWLDSRLRDLHRELERRLFPECRGINDWVGRIDIYYKSSLVTERMVRLWSCTKSHLTISHKRWIRSGPRVQWLVDHSVWSFGMVKYLEPTIPHPYFLADFAEWWRKDKLYCVLFTFTLYYICVVLSNIHATTSDDSNWFSKCCNAP